MLYTPLDRMPTCGGSERGNRLLRLLVGLGLQITRTAIVPNGYLKEVNRKGGW
jgi:hypothetical protein